MQAYLLPTNLNHTLYIILDMSQPCRILERCNHSLNLQIVVKAVDTLLPAYATHLVPTKRNCSIKHVKAINPHGSSPQSPHQCIGCVQALGEHARSKTIARFVCSSYNFINVPVYKSNRNG